MKRGGLLLSFLMFATSTAWMMYACFPTRTNEKRPIKSDAKERLCNFAVLLTTLFGI